MELVRCRREQVHYRKDEEHHWMEPGQHWKEQEPEHQGHWWEGSCTQSR